MKYFAIFCTTNYPFYLSVISGFEDITGYAVTNILRVLSLPFLHKSCLKPLNSVEQGRLSSRRLTWYWSIRAKVTLEGHPRKCVK